MTKRNKFQAAKAAVADSGIPAPQGPSDIIDTDYVIGQDNVALKSLGFNLDVHGKVFTISALTILLFVIVTLAL